MTNKPSFPEFHNLEIDKEMNCISAKVVRVYDYWKAKSLDTFPAWADINLMDIYDCVPLMMVKEYVPESGDWRNRFFGTGLTEILGVEGTGKLLDDYHDQDNTAKAKAFFDSIKDQKIPVRVEGQCIVLNRDFSYLEGIYLPLIDETGEVNMILCVEDYS